MSVADAELRPALEAALGPLVAVRRSPSPWASRAALEDLHVQPADGPSVHLVLKSGGRRTAHEARVYRDVLAGADLGTPALVAAGTRDGGWLVLEHVTGVPLWQQASVPDWCAAARWLRTAHRVLRPDPHWPPPDDHLARAQARDPRAASLRGAYEQARAVLAQEPQTVVHGEAFPSNLLVGPAGICAVDWESAGAGCGLLDLAALTAGWGRRSADRISAAYGAGGPALRAARLVVAVQWLGAGSPSAGAGGGWAARTDWWTLAQEALA